MGTSQWCRSISLSVPSFSTEGKEMESLLRQEPWLEAGWEVCKEYKDGGRMVVAYVHTAFHALACAYAEACSLNDQEHDYVVARYEHRVVAG